MNLKSGKKMCIVHPAESHKETTGSMAKEFFGTPCNLLSGKMIMINDL